MKFEFNNLIMRMTPETQREYRILQEEFGSCTLERTLPNFQYVTTHSGDFVKRVITRLQRLPPILE